MAEQVQSGNSSLSNAAAAPSIRTFQLDPSGLGGIAESLNLFRGDINLPLTLLTVSSRSGLEASATILYHSNVWQQVDTWNLAAPTGPLGLGWSLGFDFIARDNQRSGARADEQYYLVGGGSVNRLHMVTQTPDYSEFEAENYQFWRIQYYPAKEEWIVIKEEGNHYLFGGSTDNAQTSPVQYNVKWGGLTGNWQDSSTVATGQTLTAVAWNLVRIQTPFGDGIEFSYENELAQVGNGLSYTVAARLRQVKAPYSRSLTFHYADKEYSDTIREYQLPHVLPTYPNFHAYQDRLETKYLDCIELRNADDAAAAPGELLTTARFAYELVNLALANPDDPDFYKRYLIGIKLEAASGLALPSFAFAYYNATGAPEEGAQRGGLKNIVYPQGGTVTYRYATTALAGTSRTRQWVPQGVPRVWHGPDYTVYTEYAHTQLTVKVLSWNGNWVEAPQVYSLQEPINLATFDASVQADFFALSFISDVNNPSLYVVLFHKEKGRFGQWVVEPSFARLAVPQGGQGLVVTGNQFVMALASASKWVKVWDKRTQSWQDRTNDIVVPSNAQYALAATRDYLALASYTANTQQVQLAQYYLDVTGRFRAATLGARVLSSVRWQADSTPHTFWALGRDYFVTTYATAVTDTQIAYRVQIQQWNEQFVGQLVVDDSRTVPGNTKLPFAQSVASGSVVGNLGYLYRYDGLQWQTGTLTFDGSNGSPMFAYGADAAISASASRAHLMQYDAYGDLWQQVLSSGGSSLNPTISGEFLSVGPQLYYCDSQGQLQLRYNFPANLQANSLSNRAPLFLAWQDSTGNASVLLVKNGRVATNPIVLANQQVYTGSSDPGTNLVGTSALLTYAGTFDNPSQFTLYQCVNDDIQGAITCYPVSALSIDDGYPVLWGSYDARSLYTRYYYDCAQVTVSPDGAITEFAAATAVYGGQDPGTGVCYPPADTNHLGRSEYRYYNNGATSLTLNWETEAETNYYYSYLNGMLFDKTDFDQEGNPVQRLVNYYEVRTQYAAVEAPATLLPLIGAYVKTMATESTQYEEPIVLAATATYGQATDWLPVAREWLLARSSQANALEVRPAGQPNRWKLYPFAGRQTYYPVALRNGMLTAATGVTRTVSCEYAYATGLLTADETDNYTMEGAREVFRREIYFAYQVATYAVLQARHIWSPVVASLRFQRLGGGAAPGSPVELALTTYAAWGTGSDTTTPWAPVATWIGTSAQAYEASQLPPVAFTAWSNPAQQEPHWQKTGEVTRRSPIGAVQEALDAAGNPSAILTGQHDRYRVAEFANAYGPETAYLGFETYEDASGWTLARGSVSELVLTGDAHTGSACLRLPADATQALRKSAQLRNNGKRYILSCWLKTAAGFEADAGTATWSVEDTHGNELQSFVVVGTADTWAYRHYPLSLGDAAQDGSFVDVTLVLRNAKQNPGSALLLDDVLLCPLLSSSGATVYEATYGDILASLTPAGQVKQTGYDSYRRAMVQTVNGQTTAATALFLLRQWLPGSGFRFPEFWPNAVLEIAAGVGGQLAALMQGEAWRTEWASPELTDWRTADGQLRYQGSAASTITFKPTQNLADYGARVSLCQPLATNGAPIAPTQPLGMALGPDLRVTWAPATGWNLTLAGSTTALTPPLAGTTGFGTEWLLVASKDPVSGTTSVFFLVDGLLLYSNLQSPAIAGALSLTLSESGYGFTTIATFQNPSLGIIYLDGAGKELQKISYDGSGSIVQETVYDPVGRAALGTKATRLAATAPVYQADFVQSFDPATGLMTGTVATLNPEAEGYPYVRSAFRPTAQALVVSQGLPGKDFAINSLGGVPNPNVSTLSYGTNDADQFAGTAWPAGQYFVIKTVNADGQQRLTVTTKAGQEIAKLQGPLADGSYATDWAYYDGAQRLVKRLPPNGVQEVQAGTGTGEQWATHSSYSFTGNLETETSPDAGTTQYVYDVSGQVRFSLVARNTAISPGASDTIAYAKYDQLGRPTETGFFQATWDRDSLTAYALTDASYPGPAVVHVVGSTFAYDGDGRDATQFGQLLEAREYDNQGTLQVTTTFAYNLAGALVGKTTVASGYDAAARTVGYQYDNMGNVVQVNYPGEATLPTVTYGYNKLTQVYCIGDGTQPDALGKFRYNAEGAITGSLLSLAASLAVLRQSTYNPPGWPLTTENRLSDTTLLLKEALAYTQDGYQDAAYYAGKIAQASYTDGDGSYAYKFAYDNLSRLVTAQNTADAALNLGVAAPLTYDANGNILTLARGTTQASYRYADSTNQLTTVSQDGTTTEFSYDASGGTTSATGAADLTAIAYQTTGPLATALTVSPNAKTGTSNTQLKLTYDAGGNRTVKKLLDNEQQELSAKLYVRGQGPDSLFEQARAGGSTRNTQYLYGPDGLLGMVSGASRYVVVKDHLGSIRKVVDGTGAVVASFDYTPFGITITKTGSTAPDVIFYRYTGQEFDPETGLYNFPARMYDPETGRFYTTDPKLVGGTPYAYVLNNPGNLVDPDGQEPLTAFLIAVVIAAIVGAIAGAITYAVTHQGSFNVGEFFAYTAVGLVAGAIGGAVGYGAGVLTTAGLAAAGMATSTSIGSGIVVGAVSGAADGVVSGSLNQIGVNLVERQPALDGVGMQALIGGIIGGAGGGVAGGVTGKLHVPTAKRLTNPDVSISDSSGGFNYNSARNTRELHEIGDIMDTLNGANNSVGTNDVLSLSGHGGPSRATIRFSDFAEDPRVEASAIAAALGGKNFNGRGIDLTWVCYAGRNGTARTLANDLNVPVRAANVKVGVNIFGEVNISTRKIMSLSEKITAGGFRTYYPSQLKTGWIALFGY